MVDEGDAELRVLKVDLLAESYKTHRIEHGGHPDQFPAMVWFTRRLTPYERAELSNHGIDISILDNDPMRGIIITSPQFFAQAIETIVRELPGVTADATKAWADAKAVDEDIAALVQQINLKLTQEG